MVSLVNIDDNTEIDSVEVGSDMCKKNACQISLPLPLGTIDYTVNVTARNIFGSSNSTKFTGIISKFSVCFVKVTLHTVTLYTDGTIEPNFTIVFDECVATAYCSDIISKNCILQYSLESSYNNLTELSNGSQLMSSTQYYIQITVLLNSIPFVVRINATTEKGTYIIQ